MKIRELVYCALTVVILCAGLLLWGSRSLDGTGRAACLVVTGNWHEVGAGSASGGGISDNGSNSMSPSLAIAPDGTPYVAWVDEGWDYEIYGAALEREQLGRGRGWLSQRRRYQPGQL